MEEICSSIKGIYRDVLKDRNNNVIFDSGWVSNVIVDNCRRLLAAFMRNNINEQPSGIQYLKVGKGDPDWDDTGAPAPNTSLAHLEDLDPVKIENLVLSYLHEQDENQEVDYPTSRLQITVTMGENVPPVPEGESSLRTYPLREFGLFGKVGNEEYMIDCIRHPVINKDKKTTLTRVVRLYF